MAMSDNFIRLVCAYGGQYRHRLQQKYQPESLLRDWRLALSFFLFDHAFYQGRRDAISEKVATAAKDVVMPGLSSDSLSPGSEELLADLEAKLLETIGKGMVGKSRDIQMVVSTLRYISRLPDHNIVTHSVSRIRESKVGEHYNELQAAKNKQGIVQVGPKIASFYLRDVVWLFELDGEVPADFQFCLQPIDVWVRRFARRTGMVPEKASDTEIQQAVVTLCAEGGYSPLSFNTGLWHVGQNAYTVLLDLLSDDRLSVATGRR